MEYLIGLGLAIAVSVFARFVGLDRDRAFYPTAMFVIASYYGLFALIGNSMTALAHESFAIGGFILLSTLGFKINLWLVVAALFGHGVYDFFHSHLVTNPGMPPWWPGFCGTYDVIAAGCLAWLLWRGKNSAKPRRESHSAEDSVS